MSNKMHFLRCGFKDGVPVEWVPMEYSGDFVNGCLWTVRTNKHGRIVLVMHMGKMAYRKACSLTVYIIQV